jgi:hypothetical protein
MRRGRWGGYPRELIAVGLVGVGASLAACNLIAGIHEGVLVDAEADGGGVTRRDATSGPDGGRRDGGRKDATSADGGTKDGGTHLDSHAGNDATEAGGPSTYTCSVVHAAPTMLGSIGLGSGNESYKLQIFLESSTGQPEFQVVVADPATSAYNVLTFGGGRTNIPLMANSVLAITRYPAGVAALIETQASGHNILAVATLADGAGAGGWIQQAIVADPSLLSACTSQLQGELVVNDATAQDYTLAWTCIAGGPTMLNVLKYAGGASTVTSWPWVGDAGSNGLQLSGLAENASDISLLSSSGTSGGAAPAPGSTPTLDILTTTFADAGAPTARVLPIVDASGFLKGLTLNATNNDDIGVALVQANVSAPSGDVVVYVGSVSSAKLATLNPQTDLKATPVAGLGDAPVFGESPHWQSFPPPALPGDNLLALGPDVTSQAGLEFMWWNGAGQLVAQNVGKSAFLYEPEAGTSGSLLDCAVTFASPPSVATAKLEIAYLLANADGTTADVMANEVDCFAASGP